MRSCRGGRSAGVIAVLTALVTVLAGCTGVPHSSRPEVVKSLSVNGDVSPVPLVKPKPGLVPNDLVQQFLSVNSLPTGNYASARNFLTPAERSRWQDTTATVVDTTTVGLFHPKHPRIVVRGRTLGTVSSTGVYSPTLAATNGRQSTFVFGIDKIDGQYRISSIPHNLGLLLTESQFQTSFSERDLYFFDLAQKYLVPDPRWTPLSDPTQLDEYLMTQLSAGPSAQLSSAVNTLPAPAGARRINVTVGTTTKIDIPGASQLSAAGRGRLAAQIAFTLDDADRRTFEITDGGTPVTIPTIGRASFTTADFPDLSGPPQPAGDVYFVRKSKLVSSEDFENVPGAVNNGNHPIESVAVSRSDPTAELSIAAVGSTAARLLVGTQQTGLRATSLSGLTSRPAFAPGRNEVWMGVGSKIDLADITNRTAKIIHAGGLPPALAGGQIVALRLSPEGSRIAIVVKTVGAGQQLYIGSIVRGGGQVHVDGLLQINPQDAVITDVGWIESTKLYATGYARVGFYAHIYETDVDGSAWSQMGITGMPNGPKSFTVTPGEPAWATSENSLFVQSGGSSWASAGSTGQTPGNYPVYLG